MAPSQVDSTISSVTVESMSQHIIHEITVGATDCPDIKCGFIGEIGCCFPLYGILHHIF